MPAKLERCVTDFVNSARNKSKWPDTKARTQAAYAICNAAIKGSEEHQGYLVKLDDVAIADDGPIAIQALPIGTWYHPVWGDIEITPERIARFAANVNEKVRGQDLDVDYDHKTSDGKAAGWVTSAEDRGDDGLWLNIDFTPAARQALKNKEYRYFSPEYADEWAHPSTGQTYQDVLFGGALTNRPHLKGIAPINLEEVVEVPTIEPPEEEVNMDELLKKLAKALGLEDAEPKEEQVLESVAALTEAKKSLEGEVKQLKEAAPKPDPKAEKARKFAEEFPEEAKQLAEQTIRLREADVDKRLAEFKAIPPAVQEEAKSVMVGLSEDDLDKVTSILKSINEKGTVTLGEKGSSHQDDADDSDQFLNEVQKFLSEEKKADGSVYSFAEAIPVVSRKHPELARAYQKSAKAMA